MGHAPPGKIKKNLKSCQFYKKILNNVAAVLVFHDSKPGEKWHVRFFHGYTWLVRGGLHSNLGGFQHSLYGLLCQLKNSPNEQTRSFLLFHLFFFFFLFSSAIFFHLIWSFIFIQCNHCFAFFSVEHFLLHVSPCITWISLRWSRLGLSTYTFFLHYIDIYDQQSTHVHFRSCIQICTYESNL